MNSWVVSLGVVFLLAGCGSTVNLDTVPVEDKVGMTVEAPGLQAAGHDMQKGGVTAVDIGKSASHAALPSGARVVYFDYDSYVIKPEFQPLIEEQARYLKAEKGRKAAIEGHTDERGGREYNLALGQKRAEAVRSALGYLGVSDSQVEAVSFGKEKPLTQGADEAAMAKNRRAEINYP